LEQPRSTNLQRQAKKWKISFSKVRSGNHCAPFVANRVACLYPQVLSSLPKCFPVTGIVKYSDIITYAVLSTNDICLSFCHLDDWKKLQRRPLTAVSPLFLRKLRDQVRENLWQVEDAYRAKDNLYFAPSRCHSKPDSHQMLRRSSFVQENWGSIYGIC
jgi:hypothetical protein